MQLFCKVILDYWRLIVTYDASNVALTPVLSLPFFTGNRNNIEIFLYNWRALLGKFPNFLSLVFKYYVHIEDTKLSDLSTYMIGVAWDLFWTIFGAKWGIFDFENDIKRLNSGWHQSTPLLIFHSKHIQHGCLLLTGNSWTIIFYRTLPHLAGPLSGRCVYWSRISSVYLLLQLNFVIWFSDNSLLFCWAYYFMFM